MPEGRRCYLRTVAFVDLSKNELVLKAVLAGPPAVGKTERLRHVGALGRMDTFGSRTSGFTTMASLRLEAEHALRPVVLELYEWHGPEKADVRGKALFTGLDGVVYLADARADRHVDTVRFLEFLAKQAGRSRLARLPGLLALGFQDEGLLRLPGLEPQLSSGPTWSARLDAPVEDASAWIEALRTFGELVLARVV